MTSQRASVFDQAPEIDVSGFEPRKVAKAVVRPDELKAISETASFVSREPAISSSKPATAPRAPREPQKRPIAREPRVYRTGRNIQFNVKATAETVDRFYAIADCHGWVLGEAFERAVDALERAVTN